MGGKVGKDEEIKDKRRKGGEKRRGEGRKERIKEEMRRGRR